MLSSTPTTDGDLGRPGAIAGTSDGRYTLRSELARGGMGRIWIADDARLSRRVAIKELLEPTGQRARFERELALTSRLEHPSIVSVQDGGTWADGKPFYVMKLVSGESLDHVIARAANLADRIALLPYGLAVVDALAYAHAQGIVHRDLKPENVLVGDFGETVVIDWGLAKDLHAATPDLVEGPYRDLVRVGETLGGEVIGTPSYMPPEQALGDAVDERADVYALGALLYHVLSGSRPHVGANVEDVLAAVISGPPAPLALRAPGVPLDLVTIVDKAMARKPEDRYANAGELAVDLKRFQSGQLVGAHRYTGSQLLRRWLRKHRTAVIVAALAVVALATLGVVTFVRIVREQQAADAARQLAERNRVLADDRRVAAQGLVTFMLGDLRTTLEPIGKLALLELPARNTLAYFDARHDLTPDERESRAVALENLGDALRGRGDNAGAETNFRAAIAVRKQLTAEGHRSPEGQYLDAGLRSDLGDLLDLEGATLDSIAAYREAIAMFAELATTRSGDKRGPRGREQVLEKLGGVLVERRDYDGAQREYGAALTLAKARLEAAPNDPEAQRDMVAPEHSIGDLLAARGDPAGALVAYRVTRDRLLAQTAKSPDDMPLLRMLQLTHHRIGITLLAQHDVRGALDALQAGQVLADRLVARDPDHAGNKFEQATNLGRLAEAQRAANDSAGAVATYLRGISILRPLMTSNAEAAHNLMALEINLAELYGDAKRWDLAEVATREAVEICEARVKADPTLRQNKRDLTDAYAGLGSALTGLHRNADALEVATRGLDLARALATSDPADPMAQYNLASALTIVGTARCAAHQGDARASFDDAHVLIAKGLAAAPADPGWTGIDGDLSAAVKACR